MPSAPSYMVPPAMASLEARISDLRDELFAVAESARDCAPYHLTQLHVSLQAASNELGKAERAVQEA